MGEIIIETRALAAHFTMNRLTATLFFESIVIGAVAATLLGWRYRARVKRDPAEPRWRSASALVALVLVTLSVIFLATFVTYNALVRGNGNGDWMTLILIRVGNYLSLAGVLASLTGKGKTRWPAFVAACLMLFIWFSEGMSL
jgi:cytochrome bd-type quinol oxidase subunit 2